MRYWILGLFTLILIHLPLPATAKPLCQVGDTAQVLWGGKWWPAKVIGVGKNGAKCKIHYRGYGSNWDEWVGADRIKVTGKSSDSGKTPSKSYTPGQSVKALWGGKWWNAKILKVKGNRYYIKYDGYSNSWNEWVGTNRLKAR